MGSCSIKPKYRVVFTKEKTSPIYFTTKEKRSLLKIEDHKISELQIQRLKVYKNCAIGLLKNNEIILGGGEKPNGKLSKKVYQINPEKLFVNTLQSLKQGVKHGKFYQLENIIYYISYDLKRPHQVYKNSFWEFVHTTKLNIVFPVVYSISNIFYFACGIKNNKKPTKKVYSLNIQKNFIYILELNKLNFKLYKPIIYANDKQIVIGGGKLPDGTENHKFYIKNGQEWNQVFNEFVIKNIFCVSSNNFAVFIGKSKKMIKIFENSEISCFDLTKNFASDKSFSKTKKKPKTKAKNSKKTLKLPKFRRNSCEVQSLLGNVVKIDDFPKFNTVDNDYYNNEAKEKSDLLTSSNPEKLSKLTRSLTVAAKYADTNNDDTLTQSNQSNFKIHLLPLF